MNTNLQPYRAQSAIDKYEEPKPPKETFGFARASAPKKPHECSYPRAFKRFLYWLSFRPIHQHSLWRCKECRTIYTFDARYSGNMRWHEDTTTTAIKVWKQLGGVFVEEKK